MLGPNQQRWVNTLRSGKYEQCVGTLERNGKYCCLGVACKVAQENGVTVKLDSHSEEILGGTLAFQEEVWKWIGLKDEDGSFFAFNTKKTLTDLNDDDGCSFEEIADYIELYADQLFVEPK
jgi:hypothetical protein